MTETNVYIDKPAQLLLAGSGELETALQAIREH
jgi:hypothetical protein